MYLRGDVTDSENKKPPHENEAAFVFVAVLLMVSFSPLRVQGLPLQFRKEACSNLRK